MIVFPNAKINLGLQITGKRSDGFHNLETIFYPIPWKDSLEIQPSSTGEGVQFSQSGLVVDAPTEKNLCVRAYRLLKDKFPDLPPIKMHLLKQIPMGAGLGGGSADATFTLQLLSRQFKLKLTSAELSSMALELGSDCPFFVFNKPAFASGRGEELLPLENKLTGLHLLIIHPGIHVSTAWAFQSIELKTHATNLNAIYNTPIENWQHVMKNDFEAPVFMRYPVIGSIKQQLMDAGAVYASMSGSGSSVFGIFKQKIEIPIPKNYHFRWLELS
jgi:4-diphosphocytidyl-2-C-methyl-D-erythritol kinase